MSQTKRKWREVGTLKVLGNNNGNLVVDPWAKRKVFRANNPGQIDATAKRILSYNKKKQSQRGATNDMLFDIQAALREAGVLP